MCFGNLLYDNALHNMPAALKGKYIAGTNFVKGKHELFPIPLTELQANAKLENKQNPGY